MPKYHTLIDHLGIPDNPGKQLQISPNAQESLEDSVHPILIKSINLHIFHQVMEKISVFLNIRSLILLLPVIIGTSAIADNKDSAIGNASEQFAMSKTIVLNGHAYEILQDTSTIEFRVDSPFGEIWGNFQDFHGGFDIFGNDTSDKSAEFIINVDSLDTDTVIMNSMLKSEMFFDVENFPSMHFVGEHFEWFNESQAVLKGYMTIQNTTQPVAFYVRLVNTYVSSKHPDQIFIEASTTIKRSEFGMHTMLSTVSDKVNLFMSVVAQKKEAAIYVANE